MFYHIFIERNDKEPGKEKDKELEKAESFAKQFIDNETLVIGGVVCDKKNLSKFRIIKTLKKYEPTIEIYKRNHNDLYDLFDSEEEMLLSVEGSEDVTNDILDKILKEPKKWATVL